MDIAPTPFSTSGPDASCAFPSWPRRANLDYDVAEERASSYLSDEDLFLDFEDDSRSVSSSNSSSPVVSPPTARLLTEAEIQEQHRERANYQREMMRVLMHEKERLRQQKAAAGRRKRSSSSTSTKKSSSKNSSKLNAMTPIAEV